MNANDYPAATVRARAYVRVSSVSKERQDTLVSDEMQIDEARRYAEYMGWTFDPVASRACADLDVSGFRIEWKRRPGLMRLLEAAQRGEFDTLVIYKLSRLSRRVKDALEIIDAFEKAGVVMHFVSERIDGSSSQGRFLRTILLGAAEMQAEDISDFVKASQKRKAEQGGMHGSVPAWLIRDKETKLVTVNDEQASAMRRLVQLRIAGQGLQVIARTLNEEGFRTSEGAYWTHQLTYKYLRDEWIATMLGMGYYGRGRPNAIEIPDALPAIITQDEADRLRAIQAAYRETYPTGLGKHRNSRAGGRILSGIIYCPHCNSRMHVSNDTAVKTDGSKVKRYVCRMKIPLQSAHPKGGNSIFAPGIEDAVLRVVRYALDTPAPPVEIVASSVKKSDFEGRIADVQRKIDRILQMNLDGRLSDDDYDRQYESLNAEKAHLVESQVSANQPEYLALAASISTQEVITREEMRQLVLLMVERVDANVTIPGYRARKDTKNETRFARVTLRFPTANGQRVFLAQIHRSDFGGDKCIIPADDAPMVDGTVTLSHNCGDSSREEVSVTKTPKKRASHKVGDSHHEEEREMNPLCVDQGIGTIPWSPLARGRLARDWDESTARSDTDEFGKTLYHAADREVAGRLAEVAAARGASRASVALAWLLGKPGVTAPIVGASKPHHLEDAVAALELKLSEEEVRKLEEAYRPHTVAGFA